MLRRSFLVSLSGIFSAFTFFPRRLLAKLLPVSGSYRLYSSSFQIETEIQTITSRELEFISIEDFAQLMHFGIYTNEEKRKSVLYLERTKVTFTADNTFVKINSQMVQIPLECIWQDNEVWISLKYFVTLISKYTPIFATLDQTGRIITIEQTDVNITGIRIADKENGTLIEVQSSRRFSEKDIVLDIRNGYFHIDIYGGKINPESVSAVPGGGIIQNVQGFQMGEMASIAFKLKHDILSRDLVFSDSSPDFYVNLRTSEGLGEKADRERIREDLDEQKKRWLIDTIVLDAGHGGKDPGAIGYKNLREKDIVLPIILNLGRIIEEKMPDVNVVYTRKKDVFIPLWKRTKIANDADAKLFISVHCNSNTSSRPNGFETYFLSAEKEDKAKDVVLKENSAIEYEESRDQKRYEGLSFILATMLQSVNVKHSQFLATNIQESLLAKLDKLGMSDRGVKQGPFWVLVGATMPNVLVETGYVSHQHESRLLSSETTQKKIAEGIYIGIEKYKEKIENSI
jgi:N-acetylmuramoyl-L-alanine amidase